VKAAILHRGEITVGEIADPEPRPGQALVRTHRCALCASGHEIVAQSQLFGGPYASVDLDRPIVMGHEFVGEIVDYGAGSRRPLKTGTRVTSIPIMIRPSGIGVIGYVNDLPGGFGEYMLLDENLMMAVPDGMPDDHAALVEPIAVGLEHARVGEAGPGDVPLVVRRDRAGGDRGAEVGGRVAHHRGRSRSGPTRAGASDGGRHRGRSARGLTL
jgi:threonine dehydrogenase-like Zn-dependent dehydrogenase